MEGIRFPVGEHLLITVIPWIVGMIVGGGLGAIVALMAHLLFSAVPGLRRPSMLLPWRTLVMGLLVFVWTPFLVTHLGIGPEYGGVTVGLVLLLLTMMVSTTVLIEHWHPERLAVRLIARARTLAGASQVIAVGVGFIGGGGIGFIMMQGMRLLDTSLAWRGGGIVVGLTLVLDMVIGVVQMGLSYLLRGSVGKPKVEQEQPA
jgi:hypothetical protein